MSDYAHGLLDFGYFEVRHLIHYSVEPARLFEALTGSLDGWWGAPYLVRANATGMVIEPELGGRMYEAWPQGGALWGIVNEVVPHEMLEIQGPLGFSWPTRCLLRIELTGQSRGTKLSFLLKVYGNITAEQHMEFDEAWLDLLGERLKAYVERGEKRGIGYERLPWQDIPGFGPPEE
jgi:uncharacterized protein YndB with AHSA1/START domain